MVREIEESRRSNIKGNSVMAQNIINGLMGTLRIGADIHIADQDRKSSEKIAELAHERALEELKYPGEGSIWVSGDGVLHQGSHNQANITETQTTETVTTTTETDHSVTGSHNPVDSNDNYSQEHTTTTTHETVTTHQDDNRVTNPAAAETSADEETEESLSAIAKDVHAQCYLDANTDEERSACDVTYQNAELSIVFERCHILGLTPSSERCQSKIEFRNSQAEKMGLVYNEELGVYEVKTTMQAGN